MLLLLFLRLLTYGLATLHTDVKKKTVCTLVLSVGSSLHMAGSLPCPPCLAPQPHPSSISPPSATRQAFTTCLCILSTSVGAGGSRCFSQAWMAVLGAAYGCPGRCSAEPLTGPDSFPARLALTLGQPAGASASPSVSIPPPLPCPPALEASRNPTGLGDTRGRVSHFLRLQAR